jgi:hypothetical protein
LKYCVVLLLVTAVALLSGCSSDADSTGTGPVNRAPVIQAQADTSVTVGDTLIIWAAAHDADGDELIYAATAFISYEEFTRGYFPDAGMNTTTGRFVFRTRAADGSERQFAFSVEDGRGGEDSTVFTVNLD